jgi:hypothetical protein
MSILDFGILMHSTFPNNIQQEIYKIPFSFLTLQLVINHVKIHTLRKP